MEHINIQGLQRFVSASAEISIKDQQNEDQASALKKQIEKIEPCPDGTHVRFYFDNRNFLAIPIMSTVTETEDEWKASDLESGLEYIIKKM